MREFFHGWRRKVGCVTLVMALALFGVWMRSRHVEHEFMFTRGDRQHRIISMDEQLAWWSWQFEKGMESHGWHTDESRL